MHRHGRILKILKIAVEACWLWRLPRLGLRYSPQPVITLLSIQDTKETIRVTGRRFSAFLAAMVLGPVSLHWQGTGLWQWGFLLMFTPLCMKWGHTGGDIREHVLMTHILAEGSMEWRILPMKPFCCLEHGVGVVLNLYIPGSGTAMPALHRGKLREMFISLLGRMASELGTREERMGSSGRPWVSGPGTGIGAGRSREKAEHNEGMENSLWRTRAIILPIWG